MSDVYESDKLAFNFLYRFYFIGERKFNKLYDNVIYRITSDPNLGKSIKVINQELHTKLNVNNKILVCYTLLKNFDNKKLQNMFPQLEYYGKELATIDSQMNTIYTKRYESATYLYRGTSIEELNSMLIYDKIGEGGGRYNFVSLSVSYMAALKFALEQETISVVLKFDKQNIDKHVVHQGYTFGLATNRETLEGKLDMYNADEEEHRLPCGVVYFKKAAPTIIFIGDFDIETRKDLIAKYGSLGTIEFGRSNV